MIEQTAAQFKGLIIGHVRETPQKAVELIRAGLNETTADGVTVANLIMDDGELFRKIATHTATALDVAKTYARDRNSAPTPEALNNLKWIFTHYYVDDRRFEVVECMSLVAKNRMFAPEDFVANAGFMADLAAFSRIKSIVRPVEDMVAATIARAAKNKDGDLLERLGDSIHSALRNAISNMEQLTSSGLVEALLIIVHNFPDAYLRRAVLTDPEIRPLHGVDHFPHSASIVFKTIRENADNLTPELLAGLRKAMPEGRHFFGEDQVNYLLALKDATHGLPAARAVVLEKLDSFDAVTLMRAAFESGNKNGEFVGRLYAAFANKAKAQQMEALIAIPYLRKLKESERGTFLHFTAIAADNTDGFRANLPHQRIEACFSSIAADLVYREPPAQGGTGHAMLENAVDLLFKDGDVTGDDILKRVREKWKNRSMGDAFRMRSAFAENKRAVSGWGAELGALAQARRARQKLAGYAGQLFTAKA